MHADRTSLALLAKHWQHAQHRLTPAVLAVVRTSPATLPGLQAVRGDVGQTTTRLDLPALNVRHFQQVQPPQPKSTVQQISISLHAPPQRTACAQPAPTGQATPTTWHPLASRQTIAPGAATRAITEPGHHAPSVWMAPTLLQAAPPARAAMCVGMASITVPAPRQVQGLQLRASAAPIQIKS